MATREFRSNKYQYLLLEIVTDFSPTAINLIATYGNDHALYQQQEESILQLQEEVVQLLYAITLPQLTARQQEVIKLMLSGNTQQETANVLQVNQSSITKCINGNTDYAKGYRVSYGGVGRRIKECCIFNEQYRSKMNQLSLLQPDNKMCTLTASWFDTYEDFMAWLNSPRNAQGVEIALLQELKLLTTLNIPLIDRLALKYKMTKNEIRKQYNIIKGKR